MAVDAYVLPYPGRSVGLAFWPAAGRRRGRARTGDASAGPEEELAVYAPGELSAGELAELRAAYLASLGRALGEQERRALALRPLAWWWLAGIAAMLLLVWHVLPLGTFLAWIVLAGAATALPLGRSSFAWPFAPRNAARARRLARGAASLVAVAGAEPRQRERIADIWRLATRLSGSVEHVLGELERHCTENAWRQVAAFYAAERRALTQAGEPGPRRRRWWPVRRRPSTPPHAAVPMRAW